MDNQETKSTGRGVFALKFVSFKYPELFELTFHNPLTNMKLRFLRGKTFGFDDHGYCFQWTAGLHALCILLVAAKVNSLCASLEIVDESKVSPFLKGSVGSPAMTLEYSIGKKCGWLLDLFGTNEKGEALCYRFLKRINPGAKRPGDVMVALNSALLDARYFSVDVDGEELKDLPKLRSFLDALSSAWVDRKRSPTTHSHENARSLFS